MRASCIALTALAVSLSVEAFGGDTPNRLFREGVKLEERGKVEQACAKFEESIRAAASSEVELALGKCYERLKRTASAWNAYNTAAALARGANRADLEHAATARVGALEPWLSRVTVELAEGVASLPSLRVTADGFPLQAWTDVPMDPGSHVIEVSAAGKKAVQRTAEVRQSEGLTTVSIPPLEDVAPAPEHAELVAPEPAPGRSSYSSNAVLALGVGASLAVLTAVAASIVGGVALGDASAAHNVCPGATCSDPNALSQNNTALTLADWSTGLFVASGALLVTAVVVFFALPPTHSSHRVVVRPLLSPVAMGVAGTF